MSTIIVTNFNDEPQDKLWDNGKAYVIEYDGEYKLEESGSGYELAHTKVSHVKKKYDGSIERWIGYVVSQRNKEIDGQIGRLESKLDEAKYFKGFWSSFSKETV